MDRQRIEDEHIVARYLAGQLSEEQAAEFEAHYAQDPDAVREIERVLRLKEGLAVLKERGELDALLRERPRSYWQPALGLAASLLVIVVGVWLWMGRTVESSPIAATLAGLTSNQGTLLHTASSHVLVKMRGPSGLLDIQLPRERSAIELRIIPSTRPSNGEFDVALGKVDEPSKRVDIVGRTQAHASAEDGVVVAYLDSAQLTPGRVMVQLSPAGSGPGNIDSVFFIDLR